MTTINEQDIFNAAGLPAREQVSEWADIRKNVGDKVMGVFMGWWESKATKPGFKDQLGVALKQADGKVIGISVGDTSYMRSRLEPSEIGDKVGFKYEGDKDTGQIQPAKIIKFYNPDMEARREKGTLKVSAPESATSSPSATTTEATLEDIAGEEQPF